MSTDTAPAPAGPRHRAVEEQSASAGSTDPAARGSLTIAEKVVSRTVEHVVSEVDGATGASRHVLGMSVGSVDEETKARVDASIAGDVATVRVRMSVDWPVSIRTVTDQVRARIIDEVHRITDMQVGQVDIEVENVVTERPAERRVV